MPHSTGRRFAVLFVQARDKRLRESHTPVARERDRSVVTLAHVFPARSNGNPHIGIGFVL